MLIESENNAPGWIARVDGTQTPIYEAYTTLRGVVVGPGKHKIEMRYRPLSVVAPSVNCEPLSPVTDSLLLPMLKLPIVALAILLRSIVESAVTLTALP